MLGFYVSQMGHGPGLAQRLVSRVSVPGTLRQTTDGAVLHAQLEQGNRLRADIRKAVDRAFIAFVHALLRRYSRNPGRDPATGVRAILILQRIVPYLGPAPPEAAGSVKGLEQQVASILWSARNLAATGTPNGRAPEGGREVVVWKLGWRPSRGRTAVKKAYPALPPQDISRLSTAAAKPTGAGTAETCPSAITALITARERRGNPARPASAFKVGAL